MPKKSQINEYSDAGEVRFSIRFLLMLHHRLANAAQVSNWCVYLIGSVEVVGGHEKPAPPPRLNL